ncbi:hypothetical protein MARINON1_52102 [Marinobacter salarius]|nr:hypothetical protein MARINON1_52102 [Marinobacter salarius]
MPSSVLRMSGNLHLLLIQATPYFGCDYLNTVIRQGAVDGHPVRLKEKLRLQGLHWIKHCI